MSDDFDKEAERRRLREKYERDREDRESTERMSELLLQGATMTNRHCDTCGSPIFRYQGQEFCPNCQMAAEANGEATSAAGQASEPGSAGTGQENQAPGQVDDASGADVQTGAPEQAPSDQPGDGRPEDTAAQTPPTDSADPQQGPEAGPSVDADSFEAIQASLTRTLARFAQRAAETEDPHRAREYLETARSAAETLRALPR
ncbi:putative Zn-finger containing protein [Halanaeroarchaeum sp. HSR-CO]|uniref:Sjogren's syndrome/scleroderma autoantigen 1 family protein n=1 Tax=Halanaeroarchaeum sp. HSR-CO TaxID=2866382 RepID=UPI00217EF3F7|nr:Sjogren's syndrome/scleroderma autoantigen 1 family protein [Halanaeroarchaeum sp. HSR-CO]UWG46387.1 putative Zn-finger containing protein [Halanaeroarchaeum sp. HSR-CO]